MHSLLPSSHFAASPLFATAQSTVHARTTLLQRGWLIGFLIAGLWLSGGAAAVRGQSALDRFDPNANGTAVRVVVVQPDGKLLVGIEALRRFVAVDPSTRN